MYKSNMNHYLLRQASGDEIHFFHKKDEGICVRTRKDNNPWGSITTIKSEVHNNFCVAYDNRNKPCILCQGWYGDIFLLQLKNQQWESRTLQKGKRFNRYNEKPFLINCEKDLMMFYRTFPENKMYLMCRNISDSETEKAPLSLDEIDEMDAMYCVVRCKDSLITFYTRMKENRFQPGYKVYHGNTGKWSDFSPVTGLKDKACMIEGYYDGTNIHTLWQYSEADNVQFFYTRYDVSQGTWQELKVLLDLNDPVQTCSILFYHETLIFYWIIRNTIYFRLSVDHGKTWSSPETYRFGDGGDYYKIKFQENDPIGIWNAYTVPGIFNGGCRLAFIDNKQQGENSKLNESLEMNIIPQQISGIKQALKVLEAKYNTLMDKLQQIDSALEAHMSKSAEPEKAPAEMHNSPADAIRGIEKGVPGFTMDNSCYEDSVDIPAHEKPLMPGTGFSNITIRFLEESKFPKPPLQ